MYPARGAGRCSKEKVSCQTRLPHAQTISTCLSSNISSTRESLLGPERTIASEGTLPLGPFIGNIPGSSRERMRILNIFHGSERSTAALNSADIFLHPHSHHHRHDYNVQVLNSPFGGKVSRKRSLLSACPLSASIPPAQKNAKLDKSGGNETINAAGEKEPPIANHIADLDFEEWQASQKSYSSTNPVGASMDWAFDWNRAAEFLSTGNDTKHDNPQHHNSGSKVIIEMEDFEPRPLPSVQYKMSDVIKSKEKYSFKIDLEPHILQHYPPLSIGPQQQALRNSGRDHLLYDFRSPIEPQQTDEHVENDFEPNPVEETDTTTVKLKETKSAKVEVLRQENDETSFRGEEESVANVSALDLEMEGKILPPSDDFQDAYARHVKCLLRTHQSTDEIQERDRRVGLRACHSKTMMESEKSRCKLLKMFGITFKKRRKRRRRKNSEKEEAKSSTSKSKQEDALFDQSALFGESLKKPASLEVGNAESAKAA